MIRERWITGQTALLLVAVLVASAAGQQEAKPAAPEAELPLEVRLLALVERLEAGRVFATLAVFSPTLSDQHLHAQRVVNLLEGAAGGHYAERLSFEAKATGLLPEARAIAAFLARLPPEKQVPGEAILAAKSVVEFLDLALDEALVAVRSRRTEVASESMRRAFALLSAALGADTDPAALGGVRVLLRIVSPSPPKL